MIYTLTLNPSLDRELTVNEFVFNEVLRASHSRLDWGGKGFNVSRALKALDSHSIALGFVGGPTGQMLADGLAALGIETDFVQIAGETRTNTSIVLADHSRHLKVNEAGPPIAPHEQVQLIQKVKAHVQPGDWWVMSGSLPPGVPPTFYADLIQMVQQAGAKAVLDTSGEPLKAGCQAGPFLIKPNRSEMSALTGITPDTPGSYRQAIDRILAMGVKDIAISSGKDGAMFTNGEQIWQASAPEIQERNPVGAGDAMLAGVIKALSEGRDYPEALAWGVACGTTAVSLDGTGVGSKSQVEELLPEVKVDIF
jgi:1-phosphofructokinase family hexose kinase